MAKVVWGVAADVFTFNSVNYDIVSLSMDQEAPEVDTTDTGTTVGTTEGLAGRLSSSFSMTLVKDTGDSDAPMRTEYAVVLNFGAKTYSGNAILYTKGVSAEMDGRIEQTYGGKFNGTVTEG